MRPPGTLKANYAAIEALLAHGWDPTTDPGEWLHQRFGDAAAVSRRREAILLEQVQRLERENADLKRDHLKPPLVDPQPAVNDRLAMLAASGGLLTVDVYNPIDELHRAEADARAMRMKLRLAGVALED